MRIFPRPHVGPRIAEIDAFLRLCAEPGGCRQRARRIRLDRDLVGLPLHMVKETAVHATHAFPGGVVRLVGEDGDPDAFPLQRLQCFGHPLIGTRAVERSFRQIHPVEPVTRLHVLRREAARLFQAADHKISRAVAAVIPVFVLRQRRIAESVQHPVARQGDRLQRIDNRAVEIKYACLYPHDPFRFLYSMKCM